MLRFSKGIALAAAIFLLSANLDHVPDSPESLNVSSKSSVSAQFAHLRVAACVAAVGAVKEVFPLPGADIYDALDEGPNFSPARMTQLLRQAADSSPPIAWLNPSVNVWEGKEAQRLALACLRQTDAGDCCPVELIATEERNGRADIRSSQSLAQDSEG
jgi:predicted signal transduction protein with EAL and GGDEF domain